MGLLQPEVSLKVGESELKEFVNLEAQNNSVRRIQPAIVNSEYGKDHSEEPLIIL